MNLVYYPLALLFAFVCVFLILLILIQKGRGGGLSGAFGGAGGNTAFGTKTGDLLTWVTAIVFGVFLALSCGLIWTSDYLSARDHATAAADVTDDTLDGRTEPSDDSAGAQDEGPVDVLPPTGDQPAPVAPDQTPTGDPTTPN